MDIDNLVRMANRIGDYFAAYPDTDEADASIAKHIQMFWTPQMRKELLNCIADGSHAHTLHAQVARAVSRHLKRPEAAPLR